MLTIPGCPNGQVLTQRLATVLGDIPEVPVVWRSVTDPREAARRGMHGSPTLLIDGRDPFAAPVGSENTIRGGPVGSQAAM